MACKDCWGCYWYKKGKCGGGDQDTFDSCRDYK